MEEDEEEEIENMEQRPTFGDQGDNERQSESDGEIEAPEALAMPEPSPIDRTGDEMEQSFGRDSQATDDAEIEGHLEQYSYKVGVAWPEGYREKFTLFKQRLVAQYKQV
jgi:hypothetical protein